MPFTSEGTRMEEKGRVGHVPRHPKAYAKACLGISQRHGGDVCAEALWFLESETMTHLTHELLTCQKTDYNQR